MKQHTMYSNSDERLQPLTELVEYEDTARKLAVKTVIQNLVTAGVAFATAQKSVLRRV